MSRAFDDAMEQRQEAAIANALGVSVDELSEHPYQLDENTSSDGLVYGVRVLWDRTAPDSVETFGKEGAKWSELQLPDEPDGI